jgi:hypothetical protein
MYRGRLLVLGVLSAALFAGGCGKENPHMIPQDRASALTATVDEITAACDGKDAAKAQAAADKANQQVSELPRAVSTGLRRNLRDWINHISDRVDRDCKAKATPTATATATETATATATETATESPTKTPTQTPSPTETPTETATPTPTATQTPDEGGVPAPQDDDG